MFHKDYVWCAVVVVLSAVCCEARPNQNEMFVKSSQEPAKLPWSGPAYAGGVMYLPEINAFLVPAESVAGAVNRPQYSVFPPLGFPQPLGLQQPFGLQQPLAYQQPLAVAPPRRRRPIANFIKYINENYPSSQATPGNNQKPSVETKSTHKDEAISNEPIKTKVEADKYYGASIGYYGSLPPQIPLYSDIAPKITELDRTLSENDRLLEKISEDLDDTTMILMGPGGQGGTRLTLRPVAKAVAGPRGVAVASPIAQAVLRRKDPNPEISYEPDSVAVAGPGGQAYSHPKLIVTYLDELTNSTDTVTDTKEEAIEPVESETKNEKPEQIDNATKIQS